MNKVRINASLVFLQKIPLKEQQLLTVFHLYTITLNDDSINSYSVINIPSETMILLGRFLQSNLRPQCVVRSIVIEKLQRSALKLWK